MANLGKGAGKSSRLSLLREQGTDGLGALPGDDTGSVILDIGLLIEDPENERKSFDQKELKNLAVSIEDVGIIEPISVTPHEDGTYMILAGHRRFRAAKLAKLKKVQVVVTEQVKGADRRKRSIISNIQREDIPPLELAAAIKVVLDDTGMKQRELANLIGKGESWVSERLRILNLSESAKEKVSKGGITQSSVDALSRISRLDNEPLQVKLIEALEKGASNRDIRDRIEKAGGSGKKNTKPSKGFSKTIQLEDYTVIVKCLKPEAQDIEKALKAALKKARDS